MTLAEKLEHVKQSEVFKLVFEGQTLGLRVKFFDVETDKFVYYDFDKDMIHNKGIVHFVNSISNTMGSIRLKRANGMLMSDDELKNGVIIDQFETEEDAIRILEPLSKIYRARG